MTKRIHFIGIGGTGISGIALMLLERGWQVSGSDARHSSYFQAVSDAGAETVIGHEPAMVQKADLVVRSSAVADSDPDVISALEAGIPVLKRSQFLPELTQGRKVLAAAGSHGKTTSTALLIEALRSAGQDPSFILGAQLKSLGSNAHESKSELFVIEADEYDRMFLGLKPWISIVTNIEHDHPDCFPTEADYFEAFKQFVGKTQPGGSALLCGDDRLCRILKTQIGEVPFKVLSFGFGEENNYQICACELKQKGYAFELRFEGKSLGCFSTQLPGRHNVLNAAAALAAAFEAGADIKATGTGIANFQGSERRFDIIYQKNGVTLVNDYGHHPTQLKATLAAAREAYPNATLWAIWEPHTFSRTQSMEKAFFHSLEGADRVIITQIYAAREADNGYTPQVLADVLFEKNGLYLPNFDDVAETVASEQRGNDLVLVFSAGKGPELTRRIASRLDAQEGKA
ncbi:MAG: UDP-N-acetylmuramate--L-alanine ligase [Anaerolineaceae bacterium]|nr:UDP-N-acetylmuramate--L-alanine ligase [Anaerolineaceae bacterium]